MWVPAAALSLSEQESTILQRWVHSPLTPQGIAQRARIILLASEGIANHAIAQNLSISRPTVILWRKRFKEKGSEGLLKIEVGRGRKPEIPSSTVKAIVHDTLYTIPPDATHWSLRTLAKKHGVSYFFIKKVWYAHNLKPHLVKTFKLSNDPHFVEKLKDVAASFLKIKWFSFLSPIPRLGANAALRQALSTHGFGLMAHNCYSPSGSIDP